MSLVPAPRTDRMAESDLVTEFRCGEAALDDFFRKHALSNDERSIGRTYVLRRSADDPATLPAVLGFYTLSMSTIASSLVTALVGEKLPGYPMPAALIARLAADERTRGSGLRVGETLLIDAFARIAGVAEAIGCLGVVTDAKNDKAEAFYQKYDFATVEDKKWPRRMFLPMRTVWSLFE
jgi:hypothetical protein